MKKTLFAIFFALTGLTLSAQCDGMKAADTSDDSNTRTAAPIGTAMVGTPADFAVYQDYFEADPVVVKTVPDYKKTSLWKRYKTLSAVGWTTLSVGLTATAFSSFVLIVESLESGDTRFGTGILIASGTLTLASVPILVYAYHCRKEAKKMALSVTPMVTPDMAMSKVNVTPGIGFTLYF